jgi:predicted ATPase
VEDATPGVFARFAAAASYDTSTPPVLSRVSLRNILGFAQDDIFPSRFTVLVGANNSGKSSLMRAIVFAQTLLWAHVERVEDDEVVLASGRNLDEFRAHSLPEDQECLRIRRRLLRGRLRRTPGVVESASREDRTAHQRPEGQTCPHS